MDKSIEIKTDVSEKQKKYIFTDEALSFLVYLHNKFDRHIVSLLQQREKKQQELDQGVLPDFNQATKEIRGGNWTVAECPNDLMDRRVEITGPTDRKMMINALNSGAKVFMADLEDALSPTWENLVSGQMNLQKAVRREIDFVAENGKEYKLNPQIATLVVRPRGWHLREHRVSVNDKAISGSLFDFGLYFFHNAKELLKRGSGPYFYLAKLENAQEAKLWNDVFVAAQDYLSIPQGSVRATVLIETILASFEMEEILYELKDHAAGLNAGRWDYIFSLIKRFSSHNNYILPDRNQVSMAVPFMKSYAQLLVKSCHLHGAHAIGGMSAFIPNRRQKDVTERAVDAVTNDKKREASQGFDGTWVAHPDLVGVAKSIFDQCLKDNPHQKNKIDHTYHVSSKELIDTSISDGKITKEGFKSNIKVALQYMSCWINGLGAVAIDNLMEDAATAEISRAQVWQWVHHESKFSDGDCVNLESYHTMKKEIVMQLKENGFSNGVDAAEKVLDKLVTSSHFEEFLTIPAQEYL
ncbi:MAG: malate synthase A [Zetaproteobacteria bacterium]|nr:malate synthase A [Pseudobdellovibrionaceae bacterium]